MAVEPGRARCRSVAVSVLLFGTLLSMVAYGGTPEEALLSAARRGDLAGVKKALDDGVDVNTKSAYGASALSFAAEKGYKQIVELLLDRGAEVDVQDQFYKAWPITWAGRNGHAEVVALLLKHDAFLPPSMLNAAISERKFDVALAIVRSGKAEQETLQQAMVSAATIGNEELVKALEAAGITRPNIAPTYQMTPKDLEKFEGTFRTGRGTEITFAADHGNLRGTVPGQPPLTYRPVDPVTFESVELPGIKVVFTVEGDRVPMAKAFQRTKIFEFLRVEETTVGADPDAEVSIADLIVPVDSTEVTEPAPWPSFRGVRASGVADGQHPPITWDLDSGQNVLWKTPMPGLAHSSPIVWGDRVFVTTAVGSDPNPVFRPGLYGDVDSVKNEGTQSWRVYCLDKRSGKILWQKVAHEGVPRSRRHMKSSHANCTPATDGKHLIVSFGSEGLYCYDLEGKLEWKIDLGNLDAGWFYDPQYQWGYASSPIIFKNLVIVQMYVDHDPHIAAFNIDDGKQVWRTAEAEEVPSWATPTIFPAAARTDLVVNATKFVRGFDPMTGEERWRIGPNSEITVATPVAGKSLVFVTGGYEPIRPIYAIKGDAMGDVSLGEEEASNGYVAWSKRLLGTYIPTPIVYEGLLCTLKDNGIFTCFREMSGDEVYKQRLDNGAGGGYAASPVAADGRIYIFSEDGDAYVIKAGRKFELLAHNSMGEVCMATPAISDGMLFVRTRSHVYGLGSPGNKPTGGE